MVSLRNLLSFGGVSISVPTRWMRAALAFSSGLAALRNREKPMVSLRNLLSFGCVSISAPTRCMGAALAFSSGLADPAGSVRMDGVSAWLQIR